MNCGVKELCTYETTNAQSSLELLGPQFVKLWDLLPVQRFSSIHPYMHACVTHTHMMGKQVGQDTV